METLETLKDGTIGHFEHRDGLTRNERTFAVVDGSTKQCKRKRAVAEEGLTGRCVDDVTSEELFRDLGVYAQVDEQAAIAKYGVPSRHEVH